MILWREKFLAAGIHFLATLFLAGLAAALVFLVWYPDPIQTMIGGTKLFLLVVGCDLVLGPLISLVIYSSRKSRRELIMDYTLVGAVQIAALVYGILVIAGTRPVYVAFSLDRLEVVVANEISDSELNAARDPIYRTLPRTGPRFVAIEVPAGEKNGTLFESLRGNESYKRPRFYAPWESQLADIRARAKPFAELEQKHPEAKAPLEEAVRGLDIPPERLRWLPVHHRRGFWTAVIDTEDGKPRAYVQVDPY
jgi:hypothetical protein